MAIIEDGITRPEDLCTIFKHLGLKEISIWPMWHSKSSILHYWEEKRSPTKPSVSAQFDFKKDTKFHYRKE